MRNYYSIDENKVADSNSIATLAATTSSSSSSIVAAECSANNLSTAKIAIAYTSIATYHSNIEGRTTTTTTNTSSTNSKSSKHSTHSECSKNSISSTDAAATTTTN